MNIQYICHSQNYSPKVILQQGMHYTLIMSTYKSGFYFPLEARVPKVNKPHYQAHHHAQSNNQDVETCPRWLPYLIL